MREEENQGRLILDETLAKQIQAEELLEFASSNNKKSWNNKYTMK